MKIFIVLMTIIGIGLASEFVPFENVRRIADDFVTQRYGLYHLDETITYYGFDEKTNAYAMVYKNSEGEPLTVVIGARWVCSPVSEVSKTLPNYYKNYEKARAKVRELFGSEPAFKKIYYHGPEEEYFSFEYAGQEILINTYSLGIFEKSFFLKGKPQKNEELEHLLKEKWNKYLTCADFRSRYDGYVDSVPYCFWSYGCSPTASAMLFWYWDSRGYGRLVDHFFDRWDNVEQGYDHNLPNVQRECAVAMYTDSMVQGGTSIGNIAPGHIRVANNYNGYSFSSSTSPRGGYWNQYMFGWLKNEIDSQRPFHWCVADYYYSGIFMNHSVAGVGYDIIPPDTFVVVHNTWGTGEYSWALWTYHNGYYSSDYVITLMPAGSVSDNIDLIWPSSQQTWMFRGLKYELTWQSQGSSIDHIKMWLAPGEYQISNDSTFWTVFENSYPNTGSYIYNVPDESLHHRINIVALNSANSRLAADGSYASFDVKSVIGQNITLHGHNLMSGNAQDIVVVGDYAYLAIANYGIGVVDISDSSLPTVENIVDIGGSPISLFYDNQYLYCATYTDSGFKVLSLSNPTSPSVIGSTTLANQTFGVYVADTIAYVAARTSGLRIVSVATPSAPGEIGAYDTPGQSYDVVIVHDTIAVVADGTRDLMFLNVSDPTSPESILVRNTPGIPKGVWYDGYLFVGDGPAGVGIMDVSNPLQPESLAWFNTGGQVYQGVRQADILFIADGPSGLRMLDISNISNPMEIGYLDSYGNANAMVVLTPYKIVMADGDDGIYLMGRALGIEENNFAGTPGSSFTISPNPFKNSMKLKFSCSIPEKTRIVIYDVLGTRIKEITNQVYNPGNYEFTWDGTDELGKYVSQGVYFVKVQTGDTKLTEKIIFVH